MRPGQFLMLRRLQSTFASASPANSSALALDLDFVLRLLGEKKEDTSRSGSEVNLSHWAKVKFNTIVQKTPEAETPIAPSTFSVKPAQVPKESNVPQSTESLMNRLQSLADSLPSRMSASPPLSFFDPESVIKRVPPSLSKAEEESRKSLVIKLPTIDYSNRDWSKVTLSSILEKLIPEEMKKNRSSSSSEEGTTITNTTPETSSMAAEMIASFSLSPLELRLLDYDQLITLCQSMGIKHTGLTDLRLESRILAKFPEKAEPLTLKRSVPKAKDGFAWTEGMEGLLLRLYDDIRAKKQAVDAKFSAFLAETKTELSSERRKMSDRGLWAVLADEFSVQAGWKVNVSDVRKKIQILKCLKVK